ncbi:hypothetical protein GCM10023082_50090 [Streptomyces tremellae]|uniref:Uncharacterized protein n=1 Tax=Streptomyces tremellae TaxID=1124239 RepID=A0ABP7FT72_9ACTN
MTQHSHRHIPQIVSVFADDNTRRPAATSGTRSSLRLVVQARSALSIAVIGGVTSGLIPAGTIALVLAGAVLTDGSYLAYERVRT